MQSTPPKEEQAAEQNEELRKTEEPATEPEIPVDEVSEAAEALAAEAALAIAVIATEAPSVQVEADRCSAERRRSFWRRRGGKKGRLAPDCAPPRQLAETSEVAAADADGDRIRRETAALEKVTKRDTPVLRPETVTGKERKQESRMRVADEAAPERKTATPEAAPEAPQNSEETVATAAIPEKEEESVRYPTPASPVTAPAERRPARQGTDQVPVVPVEPTTAAEDGRSRRSVPRRFAPTPKPPRWTRPTETLALAIRTASAAAWDRAVGIRPTSQRGGRVAIDRPSRPCRAVC